MSDTSPETLLQSALEKIVYFEARAGQLASDLEQSRAEADRLRQELGSAAQREIELRRALAELEVRLTRAHSERQEAESHVDALKRERTELIGKVLDASRIQKASEPGANEEGFDLAQFIATLRSEVARATPAPVLDAGAGGVMAVAAELKAQGRLGVSSEEMGALQSGQPFDGRTEETLFGFSIRELSAPDAAARLRAAERLQALGHKAGAPAIVAALHSEREVKVQVGLLAALSELGGTEACASVVPLASSAAPDVRIAALKALLKLDAPRAAPHLAAAMKDPDRAVRRRATLLALGLKGDEGLELGQQALGDADADVRALGCLVLGASGSLTARSALTRAFTDADLRVRRAAGQALSRLLGQDVTPLAQLDDAQRRREVRRIAAMPAAPVRSFHLPSRAKVAAVEAAPEGSWEQPAGRAKVDEAESDETWAQPAGRAKVAAVEVKPEGSWKQPAGRAKVDEAESDETWAQPAGRAKVAAVEVKPEGSWKQPAGRAKVDEAESDETWAQPAGRAKVAAVEVEPEGSWAHPAGRANVADADQVLPAGRARFEVADAGQEGPWGQPAGRANVAEAASEGSWPQPAGRSRVVDVGVEKPREQAAGRAMVAEAASEGSWSQPVARSRVVDAGAEKSRVQPAGQARGAEARSEGSWSRAPVETESERSWAQPEGRSTEAELAPVNDRAPDRHEAVRRDASPTQSSPSQLQSARSTRVAVAVATVEQAPDVSAQVLAELRAAIRGKAIDELARDTGLSTESTQRTLSTLIAAAQVVRRGHKYFVA